MARGDWARSRNQWARNRGYENYYDYRVHDYGRIPPSGAPLRGEARARAAGHRSAKDLMAAVRSGKVDTATPVIGERGPDGRYRSITVLTIDEQGRQRTYVLRGKAASEANLRKLRDTMTRRGTTFLPNPSIDVLAQGAAA